MVTWELFKEELWACFGPTDCEDFDEALSKIRQIESLRDYQKEFKRLGNWVDSWLQKALVGSFMGGLQSEISEAIRMFKPKTSKEAISLARMKDEQLQQENRFLWPSPSPRTPPALPTPTALPMKRLAWEEMQRRHAQGLCFNCNDKFTTGHKCQVPRLLLLEGHIETNEEVTVENLIKNQQEEWNAPEISLHALTSWSTPRTIRIKAQIGHHQLKVLIDSGSTHNFLSEKMAEILQLPITPTKPFVVRVANGNNLKCQGRFEHVRASLYINHLLSTPYRA